MLAPKVPMPKSGADIDRLLTEIATAISTDDETWQKIATLGTFARAYIQRRRDAEYRLAGPDQE